MKPTICKIALVAFVALTIPSHATTYYEPASANNNTNWNGTGNWTLNPDGTGGNPATLTGNDFDLNGFVVGTNSGTVAFGGNSMTLDGGTLNLRNGGTKTVTTINGTGSSIIEYNSATTLTDTTFANSGTTTFTPIGNTLTLTLNMGTLTGAGNFTFGGGTSISYNLGVTTATGYTGSFFVGSGSNVATLQFASTETFGGGLVVTDAASRITLNQDVTFSSLMLNGTPLSSGTYTYSALSTLDPTIFGGSTAGSITVLGATPEPSTYALMIAGLILSGVWVRRRASLV